MPDLVKLTAREAVRLLRRGEVSPAQLIDAAMARIEAVDPMVNALPVRCVERAREHARRLKPGEGPGWLAGLPLAIKDSMNVAGVRTTFGSPIFADNVPTVSDLQVERIERNGGIVLARSNSPEFAAGANTFNEVFGRTLNPWNTRMTCGGSSGGSAVALATGMVWLANGSDLGGSLRIPASFCSVVGFRPSPGVVAHGPGANAFESLSISGPMGRDVLDAALLLDAMAGEDPRDPLSRPAPATSYQEAARAKPTLRRVGWSPNLGFLPVDREVRAICAAAARRIGELGAIVEEAAPDFAGAREAFHTLRALDFALKRGPLLEQHRDKLKPEVIWNIEKGFALDAASIARAQRERSALYQRTADYFATFDLLVTPAVIVPPFPVEQRWIEIVEGERFDNYVDWLAITYIITLVACPAVSIPCGFTKSGLPVGLQLVGRPRGDAELLAAAASLEAILGLAGRVPIEPRS
jgi:amidase